MIKNNSKSLDVLSFLKLFNIPVYPAQEAIFKILYAGKKHNENLKISYKEISLMKRWLSPQPLLLECKNFVKKEN